MQRVPGDDRHHHVQLELPGRRTPRAIVASQPDHLVADLVDHLGHRRIHLARHDRRSRLHRPAARSRQRPARGPMLSSRRSLATLPSFDRQPAHRAGVGEHVAHALRDAETDSRPASAAGPCSAPRFAIARARVVVAGVESGADGRRAEVQLVQLLRAPRRHRPRRVRTHGRVAAELLAERDRHGVLQVRAARSSGRRANCVGLARRARRPASRAARPAARQHEQQRQPRRRREHVVGRLAHVDVIVRDARACRCRAARRGSRRRGSRAPRWRSCCATCRRRPGRRRRRTDRGAAPARISSAAATIASATSAIEPAERGVGLARPPS